MATFNDTRPVEPYLPSCSDKTLDDFWNAFSARGLAFNLTGKGFRQYLLHDVVPTTLPGIVLGCIALVGFLFFMVWMFAALCCVCCCRGRRRKARLDANEAEAASQFIAGGAEGSQGVSLPPSPPSPPPKAGRGLLTWGNAWWALLVLLALAVVGVGAWGMAESINLTDHTVSDFWALVDEAQKRVEQAIEAMQAMQGAVVEVSEVTQVLANNSDGLVAALQSAARSRGVTISQDQADSVAGVLADVPDILQGGAGYIGVGIQFLQDNVNDTITDIEDRFKPPTMAVENTWRFIPFAVIFGVLIVIVFPLVPAVWYMTWPRTAALLVALLWFFVALLMLLGTGLLSGVHTMSGDGCLYAETFAVHYAAQATRNSRWEQAVTDMILYYIGQDPVTNLTGIDPSPALQALQAYYPPDAENQLLEVAELLKNTTAAAAELTAAASNSSVQATLSGVAGPQVAKALEFTGAAVADLSTALDSLTWVANRTNAQTIYHQTKEYLCCALSDTSFDLWVAWTAVGCLGLALAVMASAVVVNIARTQRKRLKAGHPAKFGGAVLWVGGDRGAVGRGKGVGRDEAPASSGPPDPPDELRPQVA